MNNINQSVKNLDAISRHVRRSLYELKKKKKKKKKSN